MSNEARTCREYVVPRLRVSQWYADPYSVVEQHTFTDGRVQLAGDTILRQERKRADYILRLRRDFAIAVVEAKDQYKKPADGLQQAKRYASMLGLQFAYSTNGKEIVEYDFLTGRETALSSFPTPEELWLRLQQGQQISDDIAEALLTPIDHSSERTIRYYQELAVNLATQRILQGNQRVLLTMATGSGKTLVAYQICWKLYHARWNARNEPQRHPHILFLADRTILVDDPKEKYFWTFDDAVHKITGGVAPLSRHIYFATYQAIARDEQRPGLFREFPRNFFDLVIVDECHRGSADDESNWREILEYFSSAVQLGMTATPRRDDNINTYEYFGKAIYEYSLSQGIEDGFLAPYRVYRIVTNVDALGWQPEPGQIDIHGNLIPDHQYTTPHFETQISLQARTRAIARNLTEFLRRTDRQARTIIFCVNQEHASLMRQEITNANPDLMVQNANYVCRITSEEGDEGKAMLSRFQDPEKEYPIIVTTSRLLTTGVDIPTCQNIVIARVVLSMTEFKQIIGRGTRIRSDHGKLFFNIFDYTGSATTLFADPEFDGNPESVSEMSMDEDGNIIPNSEHVVEDNESSRQTGTDQTYPANNDDRVREPAMKYYVDGGNVEIVAEMVYDLGPDGRRQRMVSFTEYTADSVRKLYPSLEEFRTKMGDADGRNEILDRLRERGITEEHLTRSMNRSDADPFDLLCAIAFDAPIRSRRDRVDAVSRTNTQFFQEYRSEAQAVLKELLERYAQYGSTELKLPEALQFPPISTHGNVKEIIKSFGGPLALRDAVNRLQTLLYVA